MVTIAPPSDVQGVGDEVMWVMLGGAYASAAADGADTWFRTDIVTAKPVPRPAGMVHAICT